jgi:hypothetical protein
VSGVPVTGRRVVRSAVGYLVNNRAHMRHDGFLAAGHPIGSGVAEGACRHLVRDRMEQTGMHWLVEGARSMLPVWALHLNGQWEAFLRPRIEREQARLHGALAAWREGSHAPMKARLIALRCGQATATDLRPLNLPSRRRRSRYSSSSQGPAGKDVAPDVVRAVIPDLPE